MSKSYSYNKSTISAAFSAAATTYEQAAFIEKTIGQHLCERLDFIKIQPQKILDVGCATGYFTSKLQQLYPTAYTIGIDLAFGMTKFATEQYKLPFVCADAAQTPFLPQQFDLIFANCSFNFIDNLTVALQELQRILAPNGLLLFSALGPQSLQELGLDNYWLDTQAIGNLLLETPFKNPVVDNDILTFSYSDLATLLQDLAQTGAYNIDLSQVANLQQPCQVNIDVVFGLAWKAESPQQRKQQKTSFIPINSIKYIKNDTVPG